MILLNIRKTVRQLDWQGDSLARVLTVNMVDSSVIVGAALLPTDHPKYPSLQGVPLP
jgi:hypothetical protein